MKLNSLLSGILIGAIVIFCGFGILSLLFEFMESTGFMDEAGSMSDKRRRTIWLISICSNILTLQFFRKRKTSETQRGIAVISVLSAFIWIIFYHKSLFFIE